MMGWTGWYFSGVFETLAGQAIHRVEAGQIQPLEVSARNLHAD